MKSGPGIQRGSSFKWKGSISNVPTGDDPAISSLRQTLNGSSEMVHRALDEILTGIATRRRDFSPLCGDILAADPRMDIKSRRLRAAIILSLSDEFCSHDVLSTTIAVLTRDAEGLAGPAAAAIALRTLAALSDARPAAPKLSSAVRTLVTAALNNANPELRATACRCLVSVARSRKAGPTSPLSSSTSVSLSRGSTGLGLGPEHEDLSHGLSPLPPCATAELQGDLPSDLEDQLRYLATADDSPSVQATALSVLATLRAAGAVGPAPLRRAGPLSLLVLLDSAHTTEVEKVAVFDAVSDMVRSGELGKDPEVIHMALRTIAERVLPFLTHAWSSVVLAAARCVAAVIRAAVGLTERGHLSEEQLASTCLFRLGLALKTMASDGGSGAEEPLQAVACAAVRALHRWRPAAVLGPRDAAAFFPRHGEPPGLALEKVRIVAHLVSADTVAITAAQLSDMDGQAGVAISAAVTHTYQELVQQGWTAQGPISTEAWRALGSCGFPLSDVLAEVDAALGSALGEAQVPVPGMKSRGATLGPFRGSCDGLLACLRELLLRGPGNPGLAGRAARVALSLVVGPKSLLTGGGRRDAAFICGLCSSTSPDSCRQCLDLLVSDGRVAKSDREARLEILLAAARLYLKISMHDPSVRDLLQRVLKEAKDDLDPDLRCRGLHLWRLLVADPDAAEEVLFSLPSPGNLGGFSDPELATETEWDAFARVENVGRVVSAGRMSAMMVHVDVGPETRRDAGALFLDLPDDTAAAPGHGHHQAGPGPHPRVSSSGSANGSTGVGAGGNRSGRGSPTSSTTTSGSTASAPPGPTKSFVNRTGSIQGLGALSFDRAKSDALGSVSGSPPAGTGPNGLLSSYDSSVSLSGASASASASFAEAGNYGLGGGNAGSTDLLSFAEPLTVKRPQPQPQPTASSGYASASTGLWPAAAPGGIPGEGLNQPRGQAPPAEPQVLPWPNVFSNVLPPRGPVAAAVPAAAGAGLALRAQPGLGSYTYPAPQQAKPQLQTQTSTFGPGSAFIGYPSLPPQTSTSTSCPSGLTGPGPSGPSMVMSRPRERVFPGPPLPVPGTNIEWAEAGSIEEAERLREETLGVIDNRRPFGV